MARTDMGRLKEIYTYKNTILSALINDDNIVKALGNNEDNFLDVASISNPKDLLFNNIFPYAFIPDEADEQKAYITILFKSRKGKDKYKIGSIAFYVFAHNELLKTSYPWMRTDYLAIQIDELFNETTTLGIGKLQFNKTEDIKINKSHSGIYLEYTDISFD